MFAICRENDRLIANQGQSWIGPRRNATTVYDGNGISSILGLMQRFIPGERRTEGIFLPENLDEDVTDANPAPVPCIFVDERGLDRLSFEGVELATTGGPTYHSAMLLEITSMAT